MSFTTRTLAGLNVRTIGPTPAPLTILFLHYWGGTARTWDSSIRSLLKTHPNVNAVAYDSRGYGASTKPEGDRAAYSISRLADDALHVISGLEPQPKRVVIVGHSMGGKVAQLAAARWAAHAKATTAGFPALAGLFLASPGPSPASIVPEEFAQQLLHSYDSPETVQLTVQHALSANGWESFSEEVRRQITEDALSGSAFANEVWVRDGLPEDNEKEVVAGLSGAGKVPTVVITGDQDKVHPIPLLESAVVGKIEGAELVVLPGVGHLLPLEAEDQFVEQLSKFIGKL